MSRMDRIDELIRREVSEILIRRVNDHRIGFISVVRVKTSPDLSLATIYYSQIGNDEEKRRTSNALRSATGFIRGEVGKKLTLKVVPRIKFQFDDSIERGDDLLKKIKALNVPPAE